jgi:hypothetical protein
MILGFLSWASAPLQRLPRYRAAAMSPWFSRCPTPVYDRTPTSSASLEVSTPSAFSRAGQRHELVGPASPDRLRLQVLATSWRLHPPRACRPCFMPDPLLGSPSRALFLSRSRTLFPAPFPSWRYHRLQGLAPRGSPPPGSVVYAETERVALLGLCPSRVFTLSALARPSPVLPSCGYLLGHQGRTGSTSGSRTQRARLVSLETADPPGVCGLMVVMPAQASPGSWSRLRRRLGYVTAPATALLRIPAKPYRSRTSRACRPHLHTRILAPVV